MSLSSRTILSFIYPIDLHWCTDLGLPPEQKTHFCGYFHSTSELSKNPSVTRYRHLHFISQLVEPEILLDRTARASFQTVLEPYADDTATMDSWKAALEEP